MSPAASSGFGAVAGSSRPRGIRRRGPSSAPTTSLASRTSTASTSTSGGSSSSASSKSASPTGTPLCPPSSSIHPNSRVLAPMIMGKASKTSLCGDKKAKCTCGSSFETVMRSCLPPLPAIPQAMVDVWLTSPEAWKAHADVSLCDHVQDMYDPLLVNPIDPMVVDTFIQTIVDFSERDALFLKTSFYDKLSTFCLCTDGKCKYKESFPLEAALKAAGHKGVKLYNYDRVFFPVRIRSTWMAVMLDANAGKNFLYDPCGAYRVSPEMVTMLATDLSALFVQEVEKSPPPFDTEFDMNPFEIITPDTPIDARYGALLVLASMEIFGQMGLPESTDTAFLAFTTISNLIAAGGPDDWDTAVKKLFAADNHNTNFGDTANPAAPKPSKPKGRKTKNLKARIADANKPSRPAAPKIVVPSPPTPTTPESAEAAEVQETLLRLVGKFKSDMQKTAPFNSKKNKPRQKTTNMIEKQLLDRVVWTIGMGFPPHMPHNFAELLQEEMAAIKNEAKQKSKGKGKRVEA